MILFQPAEDQREVDALVLLSEVPRFIFHQLQEQEFAWLEFRILWAIGDREQRFLDTLINLG